MSSERRRLKALKRRETIDRKRSNNKGTILGQVDREKEPERKQQTQHNRTSSRVTKLILSIVFTWVLGGSFLIATCIQLGNDRADVVDRWDIYLQSDETIEAEAEEIARKNGATEVTVGTYLENLKELDVKNSTFRAVWLVWFSWEDNDKIDFTDGQFFYYNGYINKISVIKDETTRTGGHYQQLRVDVSISQAFHTPRFPLESHILRSYIEPTYDVSEVIFVKSDDTDGINQNINVYSYEIERTASSIKYIAYSDDHDDPSINDDSTVLAEYMDEIEVNRSGVGLYVKCFIAIWGTTLWVLIMLFVATRHRVDVFSMIPATLFGAVGNIMIGANLLPEALNLGLLEYGNIWGIFIVLAGTVTITVLNRERNHWHDNDFADKYGRFMFFSILALAIIGNIALPLASYQF